MADTPLHSEPLTTAVRAARRRMAGWRPIGVVGGLAILCMLGLAVVLVPQLRVASEWPHQWLLIGLMACAAAGAGIAVALRATDASARNGTEPDAPHHTMLEDAIESLGDGVALYGPDDRLVWFNQRFRELRTINPLSCQIGVHFADVLRSAIACGEIPMPLEGIEAWVRTRLAERRHSAGSNMQHCVGGRWIRVTDRCTRDGSVIGIHADVTELKAAEAAAEAARARLECQNAVLSTLIENLEVGVSLVDGDGRFMALNQAYFDLFDMPRGTLKPGDTFESFIRYLAEHGDFTDGDDVEAIVSRWVDRAMRLEPRHFERTRSNGRVLEFHRMPLPGGGFVTTHIDVTEARHREAAVNEAQARLAQQTDVLSTLIENLKVGVALIDGDRRFMAFNQAFLDLFDIPREMLKPGDTFESCIRYLAEHGDYTDGDDVETTVRRALARATHPEAHSYERTRANGNVVEIRRVPLPSGGWVTACIDVTEARRREAVVNEAQARLSWQTVVLSTLIENLKVGVTLVDGNGRFMALNQAYLDLYDIPRETFKPGDTFESCIRYMVEHGDFTDGDDVEATVRRIVARAMRPEPQAFERTRANGTVVDIRRVPLPSGGFVTTYIDVTEARRREVDLTEARTRLEQQATELVATAHSLHAANAAKSLFLANMSHELRTPLNAILGFSEIMRDAMLGPLDSRYRNYANDIHRSGGYLLGLISDILDTAKIDAGQLRLEEDRIDLVELVGECERLLLDRAQGGDVSMAYEIGRSVPVIVGDRLRIKQVLLNLLLNAIKFTPAGGKVRLSAAASREQGVSIVIADTGVGMEPASIARALEPFQQIDNRLARRYEGSGLGLPLAKSLVELHGGKLTIESELGKGTHVHVWLPPERLLDEYPAAPAADHRLSG